MESNLWKELKRRKVFRVIAMYAAAAYVIIELSNNIVEPLSLPVWVPTLIIVLLVIGFPFAVIFSWIFDVTPEGIRKTESAKAVKGKESGESPAKRKLRVSDFIIAVLLVAVIVLAWPRIFKQDRFEDVRDSDGKISLVVMPFQNLSGDTLYDGFELGLQDLLISGLSNSNELSVRHTQTMYDFMGNTGRFNMASITPSLAGEVAEKLDANTVIFGSLNTSGNRMRVTASLMKSKNREIYKSYSIEGDYQDNLLELADSLTSLVKNFLEIKVLEKDLDEDMRYFLNTESAGAYRHFSKGLDKFWIQDWESASELFLAALEIDPKLLWARIFLFTSFGNDGQFARARKIVNSLYEDIDEYNYTDQLYIHYFKSLYDKNGEAQGEFLKRIQADNMPSRGWWYEIGRFYMWQMQQYTLAAEAYEKSFEVDRKWGGGWEWMPLYTSLGRAYHLTGQHDEEQEIYELGLGINPDHPRIFYRQAVCAFSLDDTVKAHAFLESFRRITNDQGWIQSVINYHIGGIYADARKYPQAIEVYQQVIEAVPGYSRAKAQLASVLIGQDIDVDGGMRLIESALADRPDNYSFMVIKGEGLIRLGHHEEALQVLKEAWELRPFYDHAHYLLIQEVQNALAGRSP